MNNPSLSLGAMPVDSPCWPPALPRSRNECDEPLASNEDYFHFAIFWKASIVNNDGHVSDQLLIFLLSCSFFRFPLIYLF